MLRAAAILFALTGILGALGMPPIALAMLRDRRLPVMGGVPVAGGGPFEDLGIDAMAALASGFAILSLLEIVAARLLWTRRAAGAWLGAALFPPTLACWIGFALPIWLVVGPVRLVLLTLGRRELR